MKKIALLLLLISILCAGAGIRAGAQAADPAAMQQLSTEFMQLWTDANSARMAGEYDKAIALFNKCLDPKFESMFIPGIHSYVHMSLGMLYVSYLNLKEEGRAHLEKAIEKFEKDIQPDQPYMATGNAAYENAIANCYMMLGEHELSAEHFIKAIAFNEQYMNGDLPGKPDEKSMLRMAAPNYFYVGRELKKAGRADQAAEYMNKALAMHLKLEELGDMSTNKMLLSYIYYELGDLDNCIKYYEDYLAEYVKEPFIANDDYAKKMLDISRIALAHYYYEAQNWDKALAEIDRSEKVAIELNWTSDLWRNYHLRGKIHEQLGDKEAAVASYKKAIEVVESQRSGLKASDDRASFMEQHIEVYKDIIRLLIDLGRPDEALEYLERSKARAFLDMLGGRTLDLPAQAEQNLLKKQVDIEKEINEITSQITTAAHGGTTRGGAGIAENTEQLRASRKRLSELMIEVKNMKPEFASLVTVAPPDMAQISASLGAGDAIVEFFPEENGLHIFVITSDGVALRNTEDDAKKIEGLIRLLRSKLTGGNINDSYKPMAEKLYAALMAPVEDLLGGKTNLILVPHGALHYLPFNALISGGEFLIDKYVLTISPSASAISYILDKEKTRGHKLFALGDPVTVLPDLPAAMAEVQAISAAFPGAAAFYKEDAMETRFDSPEAAGADIIHVASHGLFYPDKPMFSALALSPAAAAGRDGFLQVHEIFGLNLKNANIVTLSACETGLAAITGGDDLVGLSRAFIYAGAPRVVVSLWTVSDVSTGELMKMFYAGMDGAAAPAAALRAAQLELKSNPDFAHPFFWAPFQMIGDWR
jgi:CHAT domain-containing protein/tetratricopeptide (TPR) repeat protein